MIDENAGVETYSREGAGSSCRAPCPHAGYLATRNKLRATIIPTPRQQGVDGDETKTGTPYWNWARLLGRVFDLDMANCPYMDK